MKMFSSFGRRMRSCVCLSVNFQNIKTIKPLMIAIVLLQCLTSINGLFCGFCRPHFVWFLDMGWFKYRSLSEKCCKFDWPEGPYIASHVWQMTGYQLRSALEHAYTFKTLQLFYWQYFDSIDSFWVIVTLI